VKKKARQDVAVGCHKLLEPEHRESLVVSYQDFDSELRESSAKAPKLDLPEELINKRYL
jgi:hypothetical protein